MNIFKPLLTVALLSGLAFFGYRTLFAEPPAQIHYISETVRFGDLEQSVLATGSVRAYQRTEVGAQVSGKVVKLYVELGQAVAKGEKIAEIDSETQQNNLNTAVAELAAYQSRLNAKQIALSIAETNRQRLEKLYAQKSASLNDVENAKQNLALAKAELDDIKAKIQVADIAVKTAKTNLGYTQIVSPIDGVIVSVPISTGQTVNANQTSPTIVQVADISKALIKLEIAEGDIAKIQVGQAVDFSTLAEPNHHYRGKIASIDPALTTLTDNRYNEQSGNNDAVYFYANVVVDNPDNRLRIGMTTQGKVIIAEKKNVLLVPNTALKKRGERTFVELYQHHQTEEREVKIGLSDSQYSEVIEGLAENDNVITAQRASNEKVGGNVRMPRF